MPSDFILCTTYVASRGNIIRQTEYINTNLMMPFILYHQVQQETCAIAKPSSTSPPHYHSTNLITRCVHGPVNGRDVLVAVRGLSELMSGLGSLLSIWKRNALWQQTDGSTFLWYLPKIAGGVGKHLQEIHLPVPVMLDRLVAHCQPGHLEKGARMVVRGNGNTFLAWTGV